MTGFPRYGHNLYMHAGTVYTYPSLGVGRSVTEGAFRALTHGYTHWVSGRMDYMEVNTHNPKFCHIRSPSMKPGLYILLQKKNEITSVEVATCECATG